MKIRASGLKSVAGKTKLSFLKKAIIVSTVLLAVAGIVYRLMRPGKRLYIAKDGILRSG